MTESIKQEIINNIFENGDKLITGPILQTVLIDMIDDVNVKDQAILSKTGSWDDAVTQIPNLATKEEVTNLSESIARDLENVVDVDLTGYATEQWVESQGYLKEHQDISNLATKTELTEAENNLQTNITSLSESVARDLANVDVDLTGYATETWVQSQGYLTEHQDISNLATKTELTEAENTLQGNITSLSESVARDLANVSVPEGVATEAWVQSQDYASKSYVDNAVSSSSVDLTGYATETWVQNQGYLKEHQDISNLATKGELTSVSESVQTDITNLSESVANSVVWKKGTGTDSVVLKVTDIILSQPRATGVGAVAVGSNTNASGEGSHAEGYWTEAKGNYSHAEGRENVAEGMHSHTEGFNTIAPNSYEHAQGIRNYSSTNQIFSVGAGDYTGNYVESSDRRRNAISVLAVPNSETQVVTSSFFVQNIGGYDGTNPLPGTNDLATVINRMSSGGGSSETLWKKGTGTDSIVQVLTENYEAFTSKATNQGAVAVGAFTTASGYFSHAEGSSTDASGMYSHAEGNRTTASEEWSHAEGSYTRATGRASHAEGSSTKASGSYSHAEGHSTNASGLASHAEGSGSIALGAGSHAEGYYANASNDYEHAQGIANHNFTNQIFSVGAGEVVGYTVTRRNAISVLSVPNSETQINTASVFVQNVGGYDGTNPEPGTNDLATVLNNTETWTFTLEDGSTVTKNVRIS